MWYIEFLTNLWLGRSLHYPICLLLLDHLNVCTSRLYQSVVTCCGVVLIGVNGLLCCVVEGGGSLSKVNLFRTTLLDVELAAHETLHGPHIDHAQACPPAPTRPIYTSRRNLPGLSASEVSLNGQIPFPETSLSIRTWSSLLLALLVGQLGVILNPRIR